MGKQLYVEEKEDISDLADVEESFVDKTEISVENEEEEEKKEDPTNITKDGGDNDEKIDNDDDFFDVQSNKSGKIQKAVEDPQKTMVEAVEENLDEVIGNFFDKPMMAQKAQMKIKRKLAKISK